MRAPQFTSEGIHITEHAVVRFYERAMGFKNISDDMIKQGYSIIARRLRPVGKYLPVHARTGKEQHLFEIDMTDTPMKFKVYAFVQKNDDWRVSETWFVRTVMDEDAWTTEVQHDYVEYD